MSTSLNKMRLALREAGSEKETISRLVRWAELYLNFSQADDPEQLDRPNLEHFLTHLINEQHVRRDGQDEALEAIRVLHQTAHQRVPDWLNQLIEERHKTSAHNVLSYAEIRRLLANIYGDEWLAATLIYGSGLRVLECLRLRVRDLDFASGQVAVRGANDRIERWSPLPVNILDILNGHLEQMRQEHIQDIVQGRGLVTLPASVAAQQPRLARSWDWQYLFPQEPKSDDPEVEDQPKHHMAPEGFRRRLEHAAIDAYIYQQISGASLRNSFAAHMAMRGVSKDHIQQMLGIRKMAVGDDGEILPLAVEGLHLPIEAPKENITYL